MANTNKLSKAEKKEAANLKDLNSHGQLKDTPAATTKAQAAQTPEQQARAKRAEAKALELAAGHLEAKAAKPLVDRAAALKAEADALAPLKQASKAKAKGDRPVCDQLKKDGTACTAKAMEGHTFCTDHRPGILHLKAEEVDKLAEWVTAKDDSNVVERIVAVFGWGQVRQAIKDGRIS